MYSHVIAIYCAHTCNVLIEVHVLTCLCQWRSTYQQLYRNQPWLGWTWYVNTYQIPLEKEEKDRHIIQAMFNQYYLLVEQTMLPYWPSVLISPHIGTAKSMHLFGVNMPGMPLSSKWCPGCHDQTADHGIFWWNSKIDEAITIMIWYYW